MRVLGGSVLGEPVEEPVQRGAGGAGEDAAQGGGGEGEALESGVALLGGHEVLPVGWRGGWTRRPA